MISILIPAKDYDCHELVKALQRQGENCGVPYELLVGEDGTSISNMHLNAEVDNMKNCRRVIMENNVGRAKMRNILAKKAQYPNIIFIDCDAFVEKEDFLVCYIETLKKHPVICGSMYHAEQFADNRCLLRYRYEKNADKYRDAKTRSKAPYDKFTTFNFAINKDLFLTILFDENITKYGHEDTLFGKELERRGIDILHINNKLLHKGIEDNATFLSKTEHSLQTLVEIKEKIVTTPLLATVDNLKRLHLTTLFMIYWNMAKESLRKNLLGKNPSLRKFNIYKLGYYLSICKKG